METGVRAAPAELPLACTLGPDDAAARSRRWQLLAETSPPRAQLSGHRLEVRWRLRAGVKDELEALAAAERRCCSFVSWSVSPDGADMVLYVTADKNRPGDVAAVPYADSGPLSAALVQNGTLKTYKGFPHGMPTTQAETINTDLLAFLQS
jgi:hypothetical protein